MMKRLLPSAGRAAVFCFIFAFGSVGANTLTANVADYNAAQVAQTDGIVAVPAGLATYTITTAPLTVGASLTFTLPAPFLFASTPGLTVGGGGTSTFTLASGGIGNNTATFNVATADLANGQSAALTAFSVTGAAALETLRPVASALPLTAQAPGIDAAPLTVGAFASEPGISVVYVGAIQFIDTNPPSLGTLFVGSPDTPTAVMSAIAISVQSVDAATQTVPVLSPSGSKNSLNSADTATVSIAANWAGISFPFSSPVSNCASSLTTGTVSADATAITIPNVPLNQEIFFCVTATGTTLMQPNPNGYAPVTVTPGTSTDFLAGAVVNVEFPGLEQYSGAPLAPTLSKAFGATSIPYGTSTSLTFTVNNLNSDLGSTNEYGGGVPLTLTNLAFTDSLPAGMILATPNGLTGSCGGGTITAAAGSGSVALSGASVAGGASCTFSVNVTANAIGALVNTTSTITSTEATAGAAATATLSVTQASNTITFAAPSSPVVFGAAPITLTASASSGLPVTFTATGPATINGNVLTITGAGSIDVTASQPGNADYVAATPVSQTIIVNAISSGVTLSSSANPSKAGAPVTFSVSVADVTPVALPGRGKLLQSSALPSGTVSITDNGAPLATLSLASGTASYTTSSLAPGSHTIVASYSGDANTAASSITLIQVVDAAVAPPSSSPAIPSPTLSPALLALLALLLAMVGVSMSRRQRR